MALFQVSFAGEEGIDAGGLTREFFHIVFRMLIAETPSICNRQLFHGRCRGHLLPTIDADLVLKWRVFWFVGVVTVQAVRTGCRGLPGLCDALRGFLAMGARMNDISKLMDYLSVDDVADDDLRNLLMKVEFRAFHASYFTTFTEFFSCELTNSDFNSCEVLTLLSSQINASSVKYGECGCKSD